MLRDKIIEIFIKVDDFCKLFEAEFTKFQLPYDYDVKKRNRKTGLCDSETITLLIAFHGGQFRNFKHFYLNYVTTYLKNDFPVLITSSLDLSVSTQ